MKNWASQIGNWSKEHPGEALTEEISKELFGLKAVRSGKVRGAAKGEGKAKKQIKDQCCAARAAGCGGKYENARCKQGGCERDDGKGNLLCDTCGTAWDQVAKVISCGVAISYGWGKGAARSNSGANWVGIWKEDWADSDVPPVYMGQRCAGEDKKGKWSVNTSFALLKKENNGDSWHKAGETWAIEGTEAAGSPRTELKEDTSPPADEGEAAEEPYEYEGLSYAKAEHNGDTFFYARFGEDQPPSTDPDAYGASWEDGEWQWGTGEAKEAHAEAKEAMA